MVSGAHGASGEAFLVERERRELASRSGVRYGVEPGFNETRPRQASKRTPRTTMDTTGQDLLGTGIYTSPEAPRLVGVSSGRIRRWMRGYTFGVKYGTSHSPPVWRGQIGQAPMENSPEVEWSKSD